MFENGDLWKKVITYIQYLHFLLPLTFSFMTNSLMNIKVVVDPLPCPLCTASRYFDCSVNYRKYFHDVEYDTHTPACFYCLYSVYSVSKMQT